MSEVVSFGNIVNSLRAVRNDYNEHLKSVPQYEAFLLVESSTQRVADTLQGVAPAMAADVAEALETAKAKFRQHLTSVPEYRALLAIDKLIGDVAVDLGVVIDGLTTAAPAPTPVASEVAPEPAQSEPVAAATPVAATPVAATTIEIAEPVEVDPAPQAEIAEQVVQPAPVEAAPVEAAAELTSADAISQRQDALQTAESQAIAPEQPVVIISEEVSQHIPSADASTAPAAETFGHEAERAA